MAAAVALCIRADGTQATEPVAQFDASRNQFVLRPIDLGSESEQVYLVLFGTGIRGRSALAGVTVQLGGVNAPVQFAGAQGNIVGLDQVNALIPRSLAGRGEVDLVLTVDGISANLVRVSIK